MKKERPVCPHCGSNAVGAEGPMQYDEAAGEWRSFGEPYDNSFFCQACERSEFNPEWKEHKFTVLTQAHATSDSGYSPNYCSFDVNRPGFSRHLRASNLRPNRRCHDEQATLP